MSGFKLKLNTGVSKASSIDSPTPTTGTPSLKLKFSNPNRMSLSSPARTALPKPKKAKVGRTAKPSAKILESRKRLKEETDDDGESVGESISVQPQQKKIKLNLGGAVKTPGAGPSPITPLLITTKTKKGKGPVRNPGTGYDSEASDREKDPWIEEGFILRLPLGDDNEYVAKAIEDKKIGVPKSQGGPEIIMKFFDGHCRRGMIVVRKNIYAATMTDLPCIIEGMKSWDKRGWWKSVDICQMFLGFARVQSEEEARTIPLPEEIDQDTHQYPHGITAPMHYVRKRRFRKRLHKSTIERVEEEVQRLLDADARAVSSVCETIDPDVDDRRKSQVEMDSTYGNDDDDEDEDAEGEDDNDQGYFNHHAPTAPREEDEEEEDDDAFDLDLERELQEAYEADEVDVGTPVMGETPSATAMPDLGPDEDSGDESFDDDEGVDDAVAPAPEIDEETKAKLARIEGTKEDIADMEKKIAESTIKLSAQTNPILRSRVEEHLRKLKQELQLKKSSIDEEEQNE